MRMWAAVLASVFGCLTVTARAADPVTIRLGWTIMPGELAPVIFTKRDLARHLDQTYRFEAVRIAASPQMIQGLAANEIDIAAFAFSSFPIAVINAGMTDLRVIVGEIADGVPGHYTDEFKIRNDSGIDRVEDLKGRILGSTGFGAASDIALRAMLVRHKMDPVHDATIIEVAYSNMTAMLVDKKIDIAATVPPYSFDPRVLSLSHTLFTGKDAMGPTQKTFWAARQGFIEKNRAALVDFLEDDIRATRWYLDPANHQAAIANIVQGWASVARGGRSLDQVRAGIAAFRSIGARNGLPYYLMLLAESEAAVTDIANQSGYHHVSFFNSTFKKRFGMTPGEWRRQARKNPMPGGDARSQPA